MQNDVFGVRCSKFEFLPKHMYYNVLNMTITFKRSSTLLQVIAFIRDRIMYFKIWRLKESPGFIKFSEIRPNHKSVL